jgi:hypothetical protein
MRVRAELRAETGQKKWHLCPATMRIRAERAENSHIYMDFLILFLFLKLYFSIEKICPFYPMPLLVLFYGGIFCPSFALNLAFSTLES